MIIGFFQSKYYDATGGKNKSSIGFIADRIRTVRRSLPLSEKKYSRKDSKKPDSVSLHFKIFND